MKMRITIVALTSIFATISICAGQPKKLPRILQRLEKETVRDIDKAQKKALEILRHNPNLSLKLLNCTLDILLFHNPNAPDNFSALTAEIEHIDNAITFFDKTPGFRQLLIPIIYETCKSFCLPSRWHEICTALNIAYSSTDETVTAFGMPTDYGTDSPQGNPHNIITNKRWIECKTVNWNSPFMATGTKKQNMRRQLIHQQELVAEYNQTHKNQLSYELYCTHPITPAWAVWLEEHAIPYQIIGLEAH